MEHFWRRGGGLPVWVSSKEDGENTTRVLLPVGMREKLVVLSDKDNESSVIIRYEVTDPGPVLGQHVVPGSHAAEVAFESMDGDGGTRMTWKNEFSVTQWPTFYNALKEWTVGVSANTIVEAASQPRLFTLQATLPGIFSPDHAAREWLHFFWGRGGGLLLPPAIPYGDKIPGMDSEDPTESSSPARTSVLRIPPFLKDSIQSVQWARNHLTDETAEVCYAIENPGWFTVPFLMHTHAGRARFTEKAPGEVKMRWDIEVRPFLVMRPVVEKLIEMAASTVTRNLQVRLAEPEAMVKVAPPRGYTGKTLGKVNKDTWLGGVLAAHLSDTRSTMEQTLSLLQPWTWGRSGKGDDKDTVQFEWSDGEMPP
jgi:hypothetical protein